MQPNAYTTKWLGISELSKRNNDKAINYFDESLRYNNGDAQVLYNLSKAFLNKKEYNRALSIVNNCLNIAPNYTAARILQKQLTGLSKD